MLGRSETAVFSKCAVLRTSIGAQDAGRNQRVLRSRREPRAVGSRRHAVAAGEAGRERADALEADGEADVGDRAVRRAQKRRGALQAPCEQVSVRQLPKRSPELAAEVPP